MNITRLNFSQSLPYIKNIIKQSNYVSIDLEMSGIVSDMESNPSLIDSVQQRYAKTKKRIEKFIPLQIGICCHRIDAKANKILFYPFNFYIYPLSLNDSQSIKFSFHAASLNFLSKNAFDFNKLFYEHVPYISKQQLAKIDERKEQKELIKQLMRLQSLSSPATKAFINLNMPQIEKWVTLNDQSQLKIDIQHIKYKAYKQLMDEIQRKFPSIAFDFTFDSPQFFNRTCLIVKKKTSDQTALTFESQADENQLMLMNEVVNCIVENKLPIIVHNGFLDMMHIFLRFFQQLPPSWQLFCQKLHQAFPYLYDTKFICSNYPVIFQTLERMTNLQNCFLKLKQDYEKKNDEQKSELYTIQIDKDFKEYTLETGSSHEAGFDALMTGYVFFRSMNKLKKSLQSLSRKEFNTQPSLMRNRIPLGNLKIPFNLQDSFDFFKEHANKIFEARSLLKTLHTEEEIIEYFKQSQGPINFYWKDEAKTSFFITFIDQKDQQKFIKKNLDQDGVGILKFLNEKYIFTTIKDTLDRYVNHNQVQDKIL